MATRQVYYMELGGSKFAWRAKPDAYNAIDSKLGVRKAQNNTAGLMFGTNNPKPVVVRISVEGGKSYMRYCHPNQVDAVCNRNQLNGTVFKGKKILDISTIGR